ncbi:MAG: SRPBCC family protein [Actinobacteria bacterium]|nr:SRPBCC family protein [Actinomycetota bacterium]
MTRIAAQIRRSATVPAGRDRVWEELEDVSVLHRLMPDVADYRPVDHGWHWELQGRRVMGYHLQPRFTVAYEPEPPERLRFVHVEGGPDDTADSHGAFELRPVDSEHTEVTVELAVVLDLNVPSLLHGVVREILRDEVGNLAEGFLDNLRAAVRS